MSEALKHVFRNASASAETLVLSAEDRGMAVIIPNPGEAESREHSDPHAVDVQNGGR